MFFVKNKVGTNNILVGAIKILFGTNVLFDTNKLLFGIEIIFQLAQIICYLVETSF